MKIPNKIKISGHLVEIIKENDRENKSGSDSMGTSAFRMNKIFLDGRCCIQQREETLIHEILEYIDFCNITSLCPFLTGFIRS